MNEQFFATNHSIMERVNQYVKQKYIEDLWSERIEEMLCFIAMVYWPIYSDKDNSVAISKERFYKVFQKKYSNIKMDCLKSGIILLDGYYVKGLLSQSYKINIDIVNMTQEVFYYYPNPNYLFVKRLKKMNKNIFKYSELRGDLFKDNRVQNINKFIDWLKRNKKLDLTSIQPIMNHLLNNNIIGKHSYERANKLFRELKGGNAYVRKVDANGRLYYLFTYLNKEIRNKLNNAIKQERNKLIEIDISNCSPYIMGCVILSLINNRQQLGFVACLAGLSQDYINKLPKLNKLVEELKVKHLLKPISNDENKLIVKSIKQIKGKSISQDKLIDINLSLSYSIYLYLVSIFNIKLDKKILYNSEEKKEGKCKDEILLFSKLAINGTFYAYIQDLYKSELCTLCELVKEDKRVLEDSKYEGWNGTVEEMDVDQELIRTIIKKCYMFWQNGGVNSKPGKIIGNVFPELTKKLRMVKLSSAYGSKALHTLTTTIESIFVFEVANKLNRFHNSRNSKTVRGYHVGTIHDCWIIPFSKYHDALQQIEIKAKKMFGFAPHLKEETLGPVLLIEKTDKYVA